MGERGERERVGERRERQRDSDRLTERVAPTSRQAGRRTEKHALNRPTVTG